MTPTDGSLGLAVPEHFLQKRLDNFNTKESFAHILKAAFFGGPLLVYRAKLTGRG